MTEPHPVGTYGQVRVIDPTAPHGYRWADPRSQLTADLAQMLHDLVHPDERHLPAGAIYTTMAERLRHLAEEDPGRLYEWLADND